MAKIKKQEASIDEMLAQALVPEEEQPYVVPNNWMWTKIGIVSSLYRGVAYKKDDVHTVKENEDCLIMRGGNIKEGQIDIYAEDNVYVDKSLVSDTQLIKKNDIIIVTSTGSTKVIGRAGISDSDYSDVAFGAFLTLVRPIDIICKKYVALYFQSDNYRNRIRELASGVNINNIRNEYITETCIPIPPLAEQHRIVDRIESLFEKIDNVKELTQNAFDTFKTRRAAILHKAFTGELTAQWREKNGVGMDSWKEKQLKDADIEIIDGDRGTNYPKKEDFSTDGYCLFLNAKNVTKNGFVFEELQFISKEKEQMLRKGRLEKGDVILTTRGTIGNIAYFDDSVPYEHIRINSGMVIYRGGKEFYKPFLCKLYQSDYILNQISNIKTGSAQPQLPIKIMKELNLLIPSISEQQEIVRILDSMLEKEHQAKELCDVIDKIELIKKAILARAFRGALDTNDPNEESAIELLKEVLAKEL